jgi:hypothetical protein
MQVLAVVKNMRSELRIPCQEAFRFGLAIAGAKAQFFAGLFGATEVAP